LDDTNKVSPNNIDKNHKQNNDFGRFDDVDDTLHIMKVKEYFLKEKISNAITKIVILINKEKLEC
jgi:hypothetical protein